MYRGARGGPMGGGRWMIRSTGRAMTRTGGANGGIQDPVASSSSSTAVSYEGGSAQKLGSSSDSNNLTISAASGSLLNQPAAGWSGGAFAFLNSGVYEDFEWVSEEGTEEEEDDSVSLFGSIPSVDEVQDAVSALQQVFDGNSYSQLVRDKYPDNGSPIATGMVHKVPSFGSDSDWMEPSMQLCHSTILHPHSCDQVYSAFDLLRTEPSVQRMVISLSSDKAVWEAVMNNEVVREIRDLYNNGISQGEENSDDTPGPGENNNTAMDFIKWVFDNTIVKATQVFEKIAKVMTEFFNNGDTINEKGKDAKFNSWLEERLRTSLLLTIVVLLVVTVSRACNRS